MGEEKQKKNIQLRMGCDSDDDDVDDDGDGGRHMTQTQVDCIAMHTFAGSVAFANILTGYYRYVHQHVWTENKNTPI